MYLDLDLHLDSRFSEYLKIMPRESLQIMPITIQRLKSLSSLQYIIMMDI